MATILTVSYWILKIAYQPKSLHKKKIKLTPPPYTITQCITFGIRLLVKTSVSLGALGYGIYRLGTLQYPSASEYPNLPLIELYRSEYFNTLTDHPYGSVRTGRAYEPGRTTNLTCQEYFYSEDLARDLIYFSCRMDNLECPYIYGLDENCELIERESKECATIHNKSIEERCKNPTEPKSAPWKTLIGFSALTTLACSAHSLFSCKSKQKKHEEEVAENKKSLVLR